MNQSSTLPTEPPASPPAQVPSMGRIVHFQEHVGAEPVAGMITRVCGPGPEAMVNLIIFVDGVGTQPRTSVPFAGTHSWGWSWPPRA